MRKLVGSLALSLCIALSFTFQSQACTVTSGCYATLEEVICGTQHADYAFAHYVQEPNGYGYYCQVYNVYAMHTIKCAGCHAFKRSELRQCEENHSHCGGTHENMCQYQVP